MTFARLFPHQYRTLALLVAIALLFAQWMGLAHKVEHASFPYALVQVPELPIDSAPVGSAHSCAAFDAAATGDSIGFTPFLPPAPACIKTLLTWVAFLSWDAPLVRHFSSRAPPLPEHAQ